MRSCGNPLGTSTRKAQVFTIRALGLRQPSINYGRTCALGASLLLIDYARSHSEVAIQGANEQIKCRASYETRCKGTTFLQITIQYAVKVSKKIRFGTICNRFIGISVVNLK